MICRYCYTGADESQEHLGSCTGTNKEKRGITDMGKNTILKKTLCKARGKREIGKKDHGGIMLGNLWQPGCHKIFALKRNIWQKSRFYHNICGVEYMK